jgi:hypothetical protein
VVRSLLSRLARTGWRRGLRDGSRTWLLLGISATTVQLLRRVLTEREVQTTLELRRGDAIEIRTVDPPTR